MKTFIDDVISAVSVKLVKLCITFYTDDEVAIVFDLPLPPSFHNCFGFAGFTKVPSLSNDVWTHKSRGCTFMGAIHLPNVSSALVPVVPTPSKPLVCVQDIENCVR